MEKIGVVTEILGDFVLVTVSRDSACGENCAACGLCRNSREMTIELKNTGNFQKGDKLRLVSDNRTIVSHSAVGYLSLTILLILGGVLGSLSGNEWFAFGGSLIGVLLGILIIKLFFTHKLDIKAEKIEG